MAFRDCLWEGVAGFAKECHQTIRQDEDYSDDENDYGSYVDSEMESFYEMLDEQLANDYAELRKENEELQRFLEDENHDEYYEKIAREEYNYAKPGERVFYDSSFGNKN